MKRLFISILILITATACVIAQERGEMMLLVSQQQFENEVTYGSELVTNGDFESGLIGIKDDAGQSVSTWTLNTTSAISGSQDGLLDITSSSSNRPFINFINDVDGIIFDGRQYLMSFDYKVNSGTFFIRHLYIAGTFIDFNPVIQLTGSGTFNYVVNSGVNSQVFEYYIYAGNSICNVQIDNVSLKEVNPAPPINYILNGTFNDYTNVSTSRWTLAGGVVRYPGGWSYEEVRLQTSTITAGDYELSYDLVATGGTPQRIAIEIEGAVVYPVTNRLDTAGTRITIPFTYSGSDATSIDIFGSNASSGKDFDIDNVELIKTN